MPWVTARDPVQPRNVYDINLTNFMIFPKVYAHFKALKAHAGVRDPTHGLRDARPGIGSAFASQAPPTAATVESTRLALIQAAPPELYHRVTADLQSAAAERTTTERQETARLLQLLDSGGPTAATHYIVQKILKLQHHNQHLTYLMTECDERNRTLITGLSPNARAALSAAGTLIGLIAVPEEFLLLRLVHAATMGVYTGLQRYDQALIARRSSDSASLEASAAGALTFVATFVGGQTGLTGRGLIFLGVNVAASSTSTIIPDFIAENSQDVHDGLISAAQNAVTSFGNEVVEQAITPAPEAGREAPQGHGSSPSGERLLERAEAPLLSTRSARLSEASRVLLSNAAASAALRDHTRGLLNRLPVAIRPATVERAVMASGVIGSVGSESARGLVASTLVNVTAQALSAGYSSLRGTPTRAAENPWESAARDDNLLEPARNRSAGHPLGMLLTENANPFELCRQLFIGESRPARGV